MFGVLFFLYICFNCLQSRAHTVDCLITCCSKRYSPELCDWSAGDSQTPPPAATATRRSQPASQAARHPAGSFRANSQPKVSEITPTFNANPSSVDTDQHLFCFLCGVCPGRPENEPVQGALRDSAPREELCDGSAGGAGGKNGSEERVYRPGYVHGSVKRNKKINKYIKKTLLNFLKCLNEL